MRVAIPTTVPLEEYAQPGERETLRKLSGETMGTRWSVALYAADGVSDDLVRDKIQSELNRLVLQMSHWRDDSSLSEFNRAQPGEWMALPEEFFHVLRVALEVATQSGGAFDPSLGIAVDRWGFGPSGPRDVPPPCEEVCTREPGWARIQLDVALRAARQPGGVALNLSAIAKGYAVDHLASLLDDLGARSYLVEIGGELRARGLKHNLQPWWVAVECPPGCELGTQVALSGLSVATSGDYQRYFFHQGTRYAHTLDPKTAAPLTAAPSSASVLHPSCMVADAWSTALTVLGVASGLQQAARQGLAAFFLERRGDQWQMDCSQGFSDMLSE